MVILSTGCHVHREVLRLVFSVKTRSISTVSMAKRVTLVVTLLLVAVNLQSFFIFEPQVNAQGQKSCKLVRVP